MNLKIAITNKIQTEIRDKSVDKYGKSCKEKIAWISRLLSTLKELIFADFVVFG